MKKKILFLHNSKDLTRERLGYYNALKSNYEILLSNVITEELITQKFEFALYGDSDIIPENLENLACPIVCFQIDTYTALKHRINISKLFDLTVVFHPNYDTIYRKKGIKNVILLPHAIDKEYFVNKAGNFERDIDVAFVGDIKRKSYSFRKYIVENVLPLFNCNDYNHYYGWDEMIDLFTRSKIVLNIPRDDYLVDANLRVFEATASGALLMNLIPSEIEKIGYVEGKHFVGFTNEKDLIEKIKFYLKNEVLRQDIAYQGQKLTLEFNNYKVRTKKLIEKINDINENYLKDRYSDYSRNILYLKYYSKINNKIKSNDKFLKLIKKHPFHGVLFTGYFFKPYIANIKKIVSVFLKFGFYNKQ